MTAIVLEIDLDVRDFRDIHKLATSRGPILEHKLLTLDIYNFALRLRARSEIPTFLPCTPNRQNCLGCRDRVHRFVRSGIEEIGPPAELLGDQGVQWAESGQRAGSDGKTQFNLGPKGDGHGGVEKLGISECGEVY